MSSRTVRLLNRHGYYLEVKKTGEVSGTKAQDNMYSKFSFNPSFKTFAIGQSAVGGFSDVILLTTRATVSVIKVEYAIKACCMHKV